MPLFISNRDITVASKYGHAISFEKNKPARAPAIMADELAALGVMPADGETLEEVKTSPDGAERKALLEAAFDEIAKTNAVEDFTAAGVPNAKALARVSGLTDVSAAERESAWMDYKAAKGL